MRLITFDPDGIGTRRFLCVTMGGRVDEPIVARCDVYLQGDVDSKGGIPEGVKRSQEANDARFIPV